MTLPLGARTRQGQAYAAAASRLLNKRGWILIPSGARTDIRGVRVQGAGEDGIRFSIDSALPGVRRRLLEFLRSDLHDLGYVFGPVDSLEGFDGYDAFTAWRPLWRPVAIPVIRQKIHNFTPIDGLVFLTETLRNISVLRKLDLPWEIDHNGFMVGKLHDRLWRIEDEERYSPELVTDILPIIDYLHEIHGWKRSSRRNGKEGWILYAYITRGDLKIAVQGTRTYAEGRLDGELTSVVPFFAPLMPSLPQQLSNPAEELVALQERVAEWQRKCNEDEW